MKTITTLKDLQEAVDLLIRNGSIKRQQDICDRMKASKPVVSNYLSGNIPPSKNFLEKFSKVFQKDLARSITGGRGAPYLGDIDFTLNGSLERHIKDYVYIPGFSDAEMYINVRGDYMKGKYDAGDLIALKKSDKEEIQFGKAYLVQTKINQVLCYVQKGDKNSFLLTGENKKYEGFTVKKSDVKAVFIVLGRITREVL